MPWFAMGPVGIAGYQLARVAPLSEKVFFLLAYAIPILGVWTAYTEISVLRGDQVGNGRRHALAGMTGLCQIGVFVYLLASVGHELSGLVGADAVQYMLRNLGEVLGIGSYVGLGAALVLLLSR